MAFGTGYKKRDFNVGDMILYPYVEDELLRGRIVKLFEDKAEIEVCFPGKKSEELNTDTLTVEYSEIIPMVKGIKSFTFKSKKKEK